LYFVFLISSGNKAVADLGERPGGPDPALFWAKNEKITEGRKAGRARKTKPPHPP